MGGRERGREGVREGGCGREVEGVRDGQKETRVRE